MLSAARRPSPQPVGQVTPCGGLSVEYPCQDRNAIGVANALVSSQLAPRAFWTRSPDEVVAAMK